MIAALVPLLLEAALRALLAAIAVGIGLRLLRVSNVPAQKAAWGFVLLASLSLPLFPHWQITPAPIALHLPWLGNSAAAAQTQAAQKPMSAALQPMSGLNDGARYPAPLITTDEFESPGDASIPAAASSGSEPAVASPDSLPGAAQATDVQMQPKTSGLRINFAATAWWLYLGVCAALFLRLVVGLGSALRLWLTAEAVSNEDENWYDATGKHSPVRASARVASPVNIGFGIVLPEDYITWNEEKLRIVLAHERSHIEQGDFWLQILAALYAALFWFSPLGWWLKRKLYELGEAISDRAGLQQATSSSSYAQILLEFAAMPRPTLTGVAMARTPHLTERVERLLNESSFRQAFATTGRRALLILLLVPFALFGATALVQVEASVQTAPQATGDSGQSTPAQVPDAGAPESPAVPVSTANSAAPQVKSDVASPAQPPAPPSALTAPAPPAAPTALSGVVLDNKDGLSAIEDDENGPKIVVRPRVSIDEQPFVVEIPKIKMPKIEIPRIELPPMPKIRIQIDRAEMAALDSGFKVRPFAYLSNGDQYAVVGDPGTHVRFDGMWNGNHNTEIDKARQMAHGHFLWFRHEDKSYIVDDPAIVAQIEAMEKPMDELGEQMKALGKQMRDLGQQQREEGMKMRDANVPTPDLSKEIADLNTALAAMQAKQGGTINQKELGDLQRQMGHVMGEIGALQGKLGAEQGQIGSEMGKYGKQQGALGDQMGQLGKQMGELGRENRQKINEIIKDSLANGKARPVQ